MINTGGANITRDDRGTNVSRMVTNTTRVHVTKDERTRNAKIICYVQTIVRDLLKQLLRVNDSIYKAFIGFTAST